MSKKIVLVFSVILVLGLGATVQASTLFHWTFDGGTVGNELISDTDIAGGLVVTKFRDAGDPDPIYDVNYGEGNLIYNSGGTSADFHNDPTTGDPGVGLFVNDYGSDTAMDLSTLGKFTIEAFIYPYTNRQSVIVRKYKGDGQYYLDLRDSGDVQFSINADENFAAAGADAVKENEWAHVAAVFDETDTEDPMKIYVNGILMGTGGDGARVGDSSTSLGIGAIVRDDQDPPGNSGQFFNGRIDEVRISDKALSPSEFLLYAKTGAASRPSPMNRAINICDGVTLSWVAGQFAAEHDIFLGTSFDDVNDATTATAGIFKSTQILDANTYTPSGLVLATTYYWRIDEVNDLDANSPWKGSVWEFTTNDGLLTALIRLMRQRQWTWKWFLGGMPAARPFRTRFISARTSTMSTARRRAFIRTLSTLPAAVPATIRQRCLITLRIITGEWMKSVLLRHGRDRSGVSAAKVR